MDDTLPPLPAGFALDDHAAPAQPSTPHDIPALPAGFTADDHPATSAAPMTADEAAQKSEVRRQKIDSIVNSTLSDADVRTQLGALFASEGLKADQVKNYEAALTFRKNNPGVKIPVLTDTVDAPAVKEPERDAGGGSIGAFGRAAVDGLTLGGARWLHGAGHAVGLDGEGQAFWDTGKSVTDSMTDGRRDWDSAANFDWNNHPVAYVGGELAGSLALPGGGEMSIAGKAVPAVLGRIGMGAAQAGTMGFLRGEQSLDDRLKNGAESALTGAAIGGALEGGGAGVSRLLRGDGAARQAAQDTYAAADRLNATAGAGDALIEPLPAHIASMPVRGATSALKHTIIAGSGIERGLHDFVSATQGARDRVADAIAPGVSAMDRDGIGARLSSDSDAMGLQAWEDRWKAANDKNYKRAVWLSNDARIATPETIGALDSRIAELSGAPGNPHGAAIAKLQSLRDDLADNQYGIEKLRLTRSDWGKGVDAQDGILRGMSKTLYGTLSRDIDSGLRAQGHIGAAQHWSRADQAYGEGLDFLRNDLPKVLGRDGDADADRVLSNVEGLVRQGKTSTLTRVLGQAPAEVSAQMRGQIVAGLGRTVLDPATGKVGFSAPMFIRQWDRLSTTAKNALFDPTTVSALNDVRTIAGAAVRSGLSDNTSKTSATTANRGLIDAVGFMGEGMVHLLTHTASATTGGASLLAHFGTEAGLGYLLSRPGVARAIAGVQKGTPNAQQALQRRIGAALARTPKRLLTLPATANGIVGTSQDGNTVPSIGVPHHEAAVTDTTGMTPEQFVAQDAPAPEDFERPRQ